MKKLLLLLLLACASAVTVSAQSNNSMKFSAGLEGSLPVGNYSDLYNFGFGASLKLEIPASSTVFGTVSAGYLNFPIKSDVKEALQAAGSSQSSGGFVPLKAGIKFYTPEGFFLEGQVGAAIATTGGGGAAFAYSPGVGYTFSGGVELGLRYEGWAKDSQTFSQFGVRVAYCFK